MLMSIKSGSNASTIRAALPIASGSGTEYLDGDGPFLFAEGQEFFGPPVIVKEPLAAHHFRND